MKAVLLVRLDDQTLYIYSSCFYIEIISVPNIVTVFGYIVGLSEKERCQWCGNMILYRWPFQASWPPEPVCVTAVFGFCFCLWVEIAVYGLIA